MKVVGLEFLNPVLHVLLVVHNEMFSPPLNNVSGFGHCSNLETSLS